MEQDVSPNGLKKTKRMQLLSKLHGRIHPVHAQTGFKS